MHPKHQEALARKEAIAAERASQEATRVELIDVYGLKFHHRPPAGDKRGLTIAYKVQRRNIVQISTAICHPNDNFSKRIGEYHAACEYDMGRRISLHMPAHLHGNVRHFLGCTFLY